MSSTLDLTKQLIAIPSYVGRGCDERKVGEYIYRWLQKNTHLSVIKQPVKGERFNVIAFDSSPTNLLIVGHMDTVETRAGWVTDPFTPTVQVDRLYGLGATDMKGSLAAGIVAISGNLPKGVMFLAYCDEEYDFAGMRTFIAEYDKKIKPELIVSLDGSAGQVGTGCRGLIEASFRLRGKSGHAGSPENGVNAIMAGANCLTKLKQRLFTNYTSSPLGPTTLNVAYCQGGLDLGQGQYGRQGNNIADIAEFVLDIRPASSLLNAVKVRELLEKYATSTQLTLENWTVRHDLGSWSTPQSMLEPVVGRDLTFATFRGYVDAQMLWQAFNQVPTCTVGAGCLAVAHTPNEYVEVKQISRTTNLVTKIINSF